MAYSNDICYEDVFAKQLKNVMQEEDLVIGISGSGNSENVIRAMQYANGNNAITLGVTRLGLKLVRARWTFYHLDKHSLPLSDT